MDNTSVFLDIQKSEYQAETEYFFIIRDRYPVGPGHSLIISKRLRRDYFELSKEEKQDLNSAIDAAKECVLRNFDPDGYNIGMNCGATAGQTVFHFHCHLIPRYKGDMQDPRGGVRHCIEGKGYY